MDVFSKKTPETRTGLFRARSISFYYWESSELGPLLFGVYEGMLKGMGIWVSVVDLVQCTAQPVLRDHMIRTLDHPSAPATLRAHE